MPLIEVKSKGSSAGRRWLNSHHILEIVEGRERDYVRMIGSGNSGSYSVDVESAKAVAIAVINAETQIM